MAVLSFISMYILMYMMVDSFAHVYPNLNQFYMAGIMTVPMVLIELWFMWSMYTNKKLNAAIVLVCIMAFALFIFAVRRQLAIGNEQFLKSMIPHHAAALLMCEHAHIEDPEIKKLCENIRLTQQSEIDFMQVKLQALAK